MTTANDRQVGGDHYSKVGAIQHWDIVDQHNLDYFQGNITKYVMRWRDKGGIQDLEKARHYIDKYIELERPAKEPWPVINARQGTFAGPATDATMPEMAARYVDREWPAVDTRQGTFAGLGRWWRHIRGG